MALDYLAIVSWGAYPTVATTTAAKRAALAASWGLLHTLTLTVVGGGHLLARAHWWLRERLRRQRQEG